jgi:hypothetical protein
MAAVGNIRRLAHVRTGHSHAVPTWRGRLHRRAGHRGRRWLTAATGTSKGRHLRSYAVARTSQPETWPHPRLFGELRPVRRPAPGCSHWGAGAVWRQAGAAHVWTGHSHAVPPAHLRRGRGHLRGHRGSTLLQAGELCLVQLCGRIRHRFRAMGHRAMGHRTTRRVVAARVTVRRGRRRRCIGARRRRRGHNRGNPFPRCRPASCWHPARWCRRRRRCARAIGRQSRPTGAGARHTHRVSARTGLLRQNRRREC